MKSATLLAVALFSTAAGPFASAQVVPVFASCGGGAEACTATATCPQGTTVVNGWAFMLVPDGANAAFGICGTQSWACQPGTPACSITSSASVGQDGCENPNWNGQSVLVSISCAPAAKGGANAGAAPGKAP